MAECNTCGGYLSMEDKIRLSMKCDANGNVVWQGALLNQRILDKYPGAVIALSLIKLSNTYTGPCLRVRNDDNVEVDINFLSNGLIDSSAILSHCGIGSGYVVTWYNQDGSNHHAYQYDYAMQPKIVASGELILINNYCSIDFDGTDDHFIIDSFDYAGEGISKIYINHVFASDIDDANTCLLAKYNTGLNKREFITTIRSNGNLRGVYSTSGLADDSPYKSEGNYVANSQYIFECLFNTKDAIIHDRIKLIINGTELGGNILANVLGNIFISDVPFTIGCFFNNLTGSMFYNGKIQHIQMYPTDIESVRENLYTDLSDFFFNSMMPVYNRHTLSIDSSIDDVSIEAKIAFYENINQPIIILNHSSSYDIDDIFDSSDYLYLANNGFFVVAVNVRGFGNSTGNKDMVGLETHDVYDVLQYIINNYGQYIDATRVTALGMSRGGLQAMKFASCFPDAISCVVDNFAGISRGKEYEYGLYYNINYQSMIQTQIGGTFEDVPERYATRHIIPAINNYKKALIVFHDTEDALDDIDGTYLLEQTYTGSPTLFDITSIGDDVRYTHLVQSQLDKIKGKFESIALTEQVQDVSQSGTMFVLGWINTKSFIIELDNLIDATANLIYDLSAKTFTVTPILSALTDNSMEVRIFYNGVTKIQVINSETTFQF